MRLAYPFFYANLLEIYPRIKSNSVRVRQRRSERSEKACEAPRVL